MGCCDDVPNIYRLRVGGNWVGLTGVEQVFLDVKDLNLTGQKAAETLLAMVGRKNYIAESAEEEYKVALLAEYNHYLAKQAKKNKAMNAGGGVDVSKPKDEKKGLFGFFKKSQSPGCCDMKIVEIGKEDDKSKKGCCDFKIVPADDKK